MGPSPSKQTLPQKQERVASNETINHPRFSNRKVIDQPLPSTEQRMEISVVVPSEKEYNDWAAELTKLENCPFILLPLSHKYKSLGLCGSSGIVTITYLNYTDVISGQIQFRKRLEDPAAFQEIEIWYTLYALLSAGHYFHQKGKRIGDVRTDNIFANKGPMCVATQYSWPMELSSYTKMRLGQEITYLSPEEMKQISFGKLESSSNPELAQAFSMGLTCLDMATYGSCKSLYSHNKFDYAGLEKSISFLTNRTNYSRILKEVIVLLCQVDCEYRPTVTEFYQWISQYSQAIESEAEFTPKSFVPKKHVHKSKLQFPDSPKKANNLFSPPTGNFNYKPEYAREGNNLTNFSPPKYEHDLPQRRPQQLFRNFRQQPLLTFDPRGAAVPFLNDQPKQDAFQLAPPSFAPSVIDLPKPRQDSTTKSTLERIEEQLSLSRKMFPS